jgi:hypothetical protein
MEADTLVPVEGTSEGVETRARQRIPLGGPTHIYAEAMAWSQLMPVAYARPKACRPGTVAHGSPCRVWQ